MRKLISLLLALVMVMSFATVAFAAEGETTETLSSKATTLTSVIKTYTVTGNTTADIYPTETLNFVSTPATDNPDTTNLTIDALTVTGATNQNLTINVPSYTKVGTYHYTISETAGNAQGVTYTTGTIAVSVLVTYDYDDADKDGCKLTATVGITADGDEKNSTLTNTYDLGSLAVSKEVTGNLGDTNKEFTVKVTFAAAKNVESAIAYTDSGVAKTIAEGWTGTKEVEITLKHGETVTFIDIPAGVTYTVVENDYTTGPKNGENGYDTPVYTYSDEEGKVIAQSEKDTVKITNNKSTTVDTGITLDSIPFVVMMVVCAAAAVLFVIKRRSVEF